MAAPTRGRNDGARDTMTGMTASASSRPPDLAPDDGLPRRGALLLLAALPAACTSPNPVLYVLAPVPGPTRTGAPRNIALRSISLARYLERSQIVRSSEGYRLDVLSNEWWGEPLDALIDRILVQELAQRLTGQHGVRGCRRHFYLAGCDGGGQHPALRSRPDWLAAAVGADCSERETTGSRGVSVTVPPTGATTTALVSAMSNAIGQLADAIAALLEPKATTAKSSPGNTAHPRHGGKRRSGG